MQSALVRKHRQTQGDERRTNNGDDHCLLGNIVRVLSCCAAFDRVIYEIDRNIESKPLHDKIKPRPRREKLDNPFHDDSIPTYLSAQFARRKYKKG